MGSVTLEFTVETAAVLYALIEKYYPDELPPLLPGAESDGSRGPGNHTE